MMQGISVFFFGSYRLLRQKIRNNLQVVLAGLRLSELCKVKTWLLDIGYGSDKAMVRIIVAVGKVSIFAIPIKKLL